MAAFHGRLVDVGGSQQLGGAEIGVHRPLAVRGDQDHRAGGGVAALERRRVEMDAEGVHVVRREMIRHARQARMHIRAAEILRGDHFTRRANLDANVI